MLCSESLSFTCIRFVYLLSITCLQWINDSIVSLRYLHWNVLRYKNIHACVLNNKYKIWSYCRISIITTRKAEILMFKCSYIISAPLNGPSHHTGKSAIEVLTMTVFFSFQDHFKLPKLNKVGTICTCCYFILTPILFSRIIFKFVL